MQIQPGINAELQQYGRFLIFNRASDVDEKTVESILSVLEIDDSIVVGLGYSLQAFLDKVHPDFRPFPSLTGRVDVPATHGDLFVSLRGYDLGDIALRALDLCETLLPAFDCVYSLNGFKHRGGPGEKGFDLTGYEDGTENPEGDKLERAIYREDGYCFVAIQQWQHDLMQFNAYSQLEKDYIMGRSQFKNEELDDAPASSHVKRTDQGTFEKEAHILRRSLPWANESGEGLMFVSYMSDIDRFELQLRRMVGLEDGIVDSLFRFSQPLTGAYFCLPPIKNGRLVL